MRPLISAFHKEQNANSSSAGAFLCVCYFQAAKYPRGINMINSDSNVIMTAVEKFYLSLVVVEAFFFVYFLFKAAAGGVCVRGALCGLLLCYRACIPRRSFSLSMLRRTEIFLYQYFKQRVVRTSGWHQGKRDQVSPCVRIC